MKDHLVLEERFVLLIFLADVSLWIPFLCILAY